MSTVHKVNFEPRTSVLSLLVRDYPLADPTLANPLNAVAFVDGEWFVVVNKKAQRAADITVLGTAGAGGRATIPSFPIWAERGRTDVQAMASTKVPLARGSDWEADVRIFDATAVCGPSRSTSRASRSPPSPSAAATTSAWSGTAAPAMPIPSWGGSCTCPR